jgi:hypothetical protein
MPGIASPGENESIAVRMSVTRHRSGKRLTRSAFRIRSWLVICSILSVLLCGCAGFFGEHAVFLQTPKDIRSASAKATDIDIRNLPIEAYPLLAKFTNVKHLNLFSNDGKAATDEKLSALADLTFTNLRDLCLLNGPLVTDNGIRSLSRIQSLTELQLEGTSISDVGCEIVASKMKVKGVNVANCKKVSLAGVRTLATAETITGLNFSADTLTTEEVIDVIKSFKAMTNCLVIDRSGKLRAEDIKRAGREKNVQVYIRDTGAMQDMKVGEFDTSGKVKATK